MDRVRVLLATRNEPYEGALSRGERKSQSLFAEPRRRRFVCGACGGKDSSASPCGRCEDGYVMVELVDPYDTGKKTVAELNQPESMSKHQIDNALGQLRTNALMRAGVIASVPWERVMLNVERREGSYSALEALIGVMPKSLDGEDALLWITERMPDPIRVPRWFRREEREVLRAEALRLASEGKKKGEIASALQVKPGVVKGLLGRKAS